MREVFGDLDATELVKIADRVIAKSKNAVKAGTSGKRTTVVTRKSKRTSILKLNGRRT